MIRKLLCRRCRAALPLHHLCHRYWLSCNSLFAKCQENSLFPILSDCNQIEYSSNRNRMHIVEFRLLLHKTVALLVNKTGVVALHFEEWIPVNVRPGCNLQTKHRLWLHLLVRRDTKRSIRLVLFLLPDSY